MTTFLQGTVLETLGAVANVKIDGWPYPEETVIALEHVGPMHPGEEVLVLLFGNLPRFIVGKVL